jgi:hypothetical protein
VRVPDPQFETVGPVVTVEDPMIIRMAERAFIRAGQAFDPEAIEWRASSDDIGCNYSAWDGTFYWVGASRCHAIVDGKIVKIP